LPQVYFFINVSSNLISSLLAVLITSISLSLNFLLIGVQNSLKAIFAASFGEIEERNFK
jgi:hypothetical protein